MCVGHLKRRSIENSSMPNTKKRAERKYAAKIVRAHSTQLPNSEENNRRTPSVLKTPARGIARYPWAVTIVAILILLCAGWLLFINHLGPFATPSKAKTAPKATPTTAVKSQASPVATATTAAQSQSSAATATANAVAASTSDSTSPCLKSSILSSITDTAAPLTAAQVAKINHTYSSAQNVIDTNKIYCAGINTNKGLIVAELDPKIAPETVNNFVFLAQNHFYDGLTFHRVIANLIAQGGDPTGTGNGGPGYKFNDEPVQGSYTAGTIAMANSGANTNGSQFFINLADNTTQFAKSYNLFGHVVQGLDVAKELTPVENGSATPDVMQYVIVKAAS
jgi:cyclophilin family peptidyl-prolyl cis-trans isomerase